MKKTLLALAISVAAVNAHAAWDAGVATSGDSYIGNGELLLVLFDSTTSTSYAQDTGIRFDDLKAGTVNLSIALDSAALNTAFGGNYDNVQWVVGAASNHWANADETDYETTNFGLFASGRATSIPISTDGQQQLDGTQGRFQVFAATPGLMAGEMIAGTAADNGVDVALNGAADYLGGSQFYDMSFGQLPGVMQPASAVGQTTNLWFFGFADNTLDFPITEIRGTATLNISGVDGTLTISQVPVPAAAWLLGSALLGLGGVARSRKRV